MKRLTLAVITAVLLATLASPYAARADAPKTIVRGGYLTCHEASGWGFIFGSTRHIKCAYALQPGYTEYYTGSISKFGVDIGYTASSVLLWAVVTPTTNLGAGSLAGTYAGATASATAGVGAGANVLIGGFKKSIQLQPVSIQGSNGLNVAAGVMSMTLHYVPKNGLKSGQ